MPILSALGDRIGIADCIVYQSWTELHLGLYERARASAQRGLDLSQELDDRHNVGLSNFALGSIALAGKTYAAAEQWFQESARTFREIGKRDGLTYALALLACAACALDQPAQARQYLREALEIAAELQVFWGYMFPLPAMALYLANLGQAERAVELYALASRYPFVANSRWFEDTVGRHITAAASGLVPEAIKAAEERGRARDLRATVLELLAELGGEQSLPTVHHRTRAEAEQ